MRVPVLTYHAGIISSDAYAGNDHIALAADLELIDSLGFRIVPLQWVVEQLLGEADRDLRHCVALSCDDGTDFEIKSLEFPPFGIQPGFLPILREFQQHRPTQTDVHMTSFVIASAVARFELDQKCLQAKGQIGSDWWSDPLIRKYIGIGNHSWDHNHPEISSEAPDGMLRGDFYQVNNLSRADFEIAQAQQEFDAQLGHGAVSLFAYPYGQANDYLVGEYFPQYGAQLGIKAAFVEGGTPVLMQSSRWALPRYICQKHWDSTQGLRAILAEYIE